MLAASYGLQNTSNNIANMQSPGFKRTDVFYSSIGGGSSDLLGSGVKKGGTSTNFNQGSNNATGNPSDLAINGNGLFIIRLKNSELVYTRSGEFDFDYRGILIDKHTGGEVQGYDSAGNLAPIHQKGPATSAGKASHEIFLQGKFVRYEKTQKQKEDDATDPDKNKIHSIYQNVTFKVENVYDAQGKSHTIELEFEPTSRITGEPDNDGKSWTLIKATYDGTEIDLKSEQQKIVFPTVDAGADDRQGTIKLLVNGEQEIALMFGDNKTGKDKNVQLNDSKLNPDGTQIKVMQNDGYGEGTQFRFSFDEDGQISYHYDNGQTIKGIHVGLARFDDLAHELDPIHDSLFKTHNGASARIGRANKDGFGRIEPQKLEASNVDPTMEFANIVVLQRMFQACSQIMNIDKQLLEELEGKS
jgi:flagellar hook protein FlgE